jgi:hypothetical protein
MIKLPQKSKARPAPEERWARLICDDETGIDRDIEMLLGVLRERHGCTLAEANTELVRSLSFAS